MRTRSPLDIHQTVTNQIVAAIEQGVGACTLPWHRSGLPTYLPRNVARDEVYHGVNVLSLWAAAEVKGYAHGIWGTYKQWQAVGAQVKGGEKGSLVVFYKTYEVAPADGAETDPERRLAARASWVFNLDQVEGYARPDALPPLPPFLRLAAAEALIAATGATIRVGGERAYYAPGGDYIQLPDEHLFRNPDPVARRNDVLAVTLHELAHWSGASHRLARDMSGRFGSELYAREELVAELASAFLCSELQLTPVLRDDHAQYVANWLAILKDDKRAIFQAAAKASAAAGYLAAFSRPEARHAA